MRITRKFWIDSRLGPRTLELNPHRVPLGIWPDHRLTRAEGRSDGYG